MVNKPSIRPYFWGVYVRGGVGWPAMIKGKHPKKMVEEKKENDILGGGFKYFLCSSLFGEMIQFDEHIFQMGWFNHQLVLLMAEIPFPTTRDGAGKPLYFYGIKKLPRHQPVQNFKASWIPLKVVSTCGCWTKNRGVLKTPKWMVYNGKPWKTLLKMGWFGGFPIFLETTPCFLCLESDVVCVVPFSFRLRGFAIGKIDSLWSRWRFSPFVWQASWRRWQETNPWRRYCWKSVSWKQRWQSSIIWLRSWRKIDDFRQKPQSMRRSPNCRRLTRDLVEPSIPHGFAFAELLSCSCMPASLCSRQAAAVQRTPPTCWWRILSTFAAGPWVGGVLVGRLPMANSMAMASSELTVSLAPASTLGMRAPEWSRLWNATLMAANQPCWAGSSSASVYP